MAVCNISVAVSEYRKKPDGGYDENTIWIDCTAWDRVADRVVAQAKKGTEVSIDGRLQLNNWEEEGKNRSKLYVVIDRVQFGEGRIKAAPDSQQSNSNNDNVEPSSNTTAPTDVTSSDTPGDDGDDLPF